ncbi:MAG TPA: glycosyltransferase family 39 protein [Terriglobales bacterium]|nr:glycosyltransferase family 39 protein [Terriglobales bacterium]
MRAWLRQHAIFLLVFTLAGLALRLVFLWKFRFLAGDSFIYGDLARNWMQHHAYAMTEDGALAPTLIRLPGYPLFLVAIWSIFGIEHYTAVMVAQILLDLGTCFVVAEVARETAGGRAARIAFALCALCVFFANYDATALTEPLAIFFAALALLGAVKGLDRLREQRWVTWWTVCGLATGAGVILRPDGGILLAAIGLYLLLWTIRQGDVRRVVAAGLLVAALGLAPLVPWTIRNHRVFGQFQPLAPRYANNPNEYAPTGFYSWVRTWIVDYISVEDIFWHVPGEELDASKLPARAIDSEPQRLQTLRLFETYNQSLKMPPELDTQFRALAEQRIAANRLRYYLWLPLLRVADMWLRPRTEALPLNSRWWEFRDDPRGSAIGTALGAANLALIVLAIVGAVRGQVRFAGIMLLWIVLRSAFLSTLENPEPRYVLECYPAVLVFAAAVFRRNNQTP